MNARWRRFRGRYAAGLSYAAIAAAACGRFGYEASIDGPPRDAGGADARFAAEDGSSSADTGAIPPERIRLLLYGSQTDQPIGDIEEGSRFDITAIADHFFSFGAELDEVVDHVEMSVNGRPPFTSTTPPFTYRGGANGNVVPSAELHVGSNRVLVQAFASGSTVAFARREAEFFLDLDVPATLRVVELRVVDPADGSDLGPLVDGAMVSRSALPDCAMNVVIVTEPRFVGSVRVEGNVDQLSTNQHWWPYTVFGDDFTAIYPWQPAIGTVQLTITPYALGVFLGASGPPFTLRFSVGP